MHVGGMGPLSKLGKLVDALSRGFTSFRSKESTSRTLSKAITSHVQSAAPREAKNLSMYKRKSTPQNEAIQKLLTTAQSKNE